MGLNAYPILCFTSVKLRHREHEELGLQWVRGQGTILTQDFWPLSKTSVYPSWLPINIWSQFSKQSYLEQGIASDFGKNWQTLGKQLPSWPRPALWPCSLHHPLTPPPHPQQNRFWAPHTEVGVQESHQALVLFLSEESWNKLFWMWHMKLVSEIKAAGCIERLRRLQHPGGRKVSLGVGSLQRLWGSMVHFAPGLYLTEPNLFFQILQRNLVTGPTVSWVIGLWTSQAGYRNRSDLLIDLVQMAQDMESICTEKWWETPRRKVLDWVWLKHLNSHFWKRIFTYFLWLRRPNTYQ